MLNIVLDFVFSENDTFLPIALTLAQLQVNGSQ